MANAIIHFRKSQFHISVIGITTHTMLCALLMFVPCFIKAQNIFPASGAAGVGTTTPDGSALLEMKSTAKGILISRMTKNQRDAIVSPATGLLIFQTNSTPGFYYYDGTQWVAVAPKGVNKALSNLSSPTAVNVDLVAGTNNTFNLGSATKSWKDIYAGGVIYLDGFKFIDNAGTSNTLLGNTGVTANIGTNNTFTGSSTGAANTSGSDNSFFGQGAGSGNVGGSSNSFFGKAAGYFNGAGNANTFVGYAAGYGNTADNNTFIGYRSGQVNVTGTGNTAFGYQALISNSSGNSNVANGADALGSNTTGYSNVAIGAGALFKTASNSNLVAVGDSALYNNATGSFPHEAIQNTAVGSKSLYSNTTGYLNTGVGIKTLYSNTTGFSNTANGARALYANTTGHMNTGSGSYALSYNTTGDENTATGNSALYSNTTGDANTATGTNALYYNTTGYSNTASGDSALRNNGSGYSNTADGNAALFSNTSGYWNVASGSQALFSNIVGVENTGTGNRALFSNLGSGNTAHGYAALASNTSGLNNTAIGAGADVNSGDYHNSSAVGAFATITASNQVRLGSSGVTSIGGYANWTNISDGRVKKNIKSNVPGLAFINKLKPVTYNLDLDAADNITQNSAVTSADTRQMQLSAEKSEERKQKEQIRYTGFVAQDVEKAAKELHYDFSGVDAAKNDKDLYGLRYAEFVVPLVKAVQELSQQNDELNLKMTQFENLKIENQVQSKAITDLQYQIDELKAMMNVNVQAGNVQLSSVNSQLLSASLSQNVPNPFNHTTTINYTLPQHYSSAKIIVVDEMGKIIKNADLSGAGKGSISFSSPFRAGASYHYSLYVDGKLVDSKQMLLAK